MKTVQMTLDEALLKKVDRLAKQLGQTRSSFTRNALREAIKKLELAKLEEKHREGYRKYPTSHEEFGVWESEQVWGEE